MAGLSPVQRTIRALKEQGRRCWIVEKWNACGARNDYSGIGCTKGWNDGKT